MQIRPFLFFFLKVCQKCSLSNKHLLVRQQLWQRTKKNISKNMYNMTKYHFGFRPMVISQIFMEIVMNTLILDSVVTNTDVPKLLKISSRPE